MYWILTSVLIFSFHRVGNRCLQNQSMTPKQRKLRYGCYLFCQILLILAVLISAVIKVINLGVGR